MRILNIGAGKAENPRIADIAGEIEFVRLDANQDNKPDVVHDIHKPLPEELIGAFDVVFASHVLEHIGWRSVLMVLKQISQAAKPDGRLYIVVPDIGWACKRVLEGRFDYGVLGVFYGGQSDQWDFHSCGWTRDALGVALKRIGWTPTRLESTQYWAKFDDKEYICNQIEVVAVRDGTNRAAGA